MKKYPLVLTAIAMSFAPAYGDYLIQGSTWEKLGYSTACRNKNWHYPPTEKQLDLLRPWLDSFKRDILASSTVDQTKLERKFVSCRLRLTYQGTLTDLAIEHSSGSPVNDAKFLDLVKRVNVKKMAPPPTTEPFEQGLVITYSGVPATLQVSRNNGK